MCPLLLGIWSTSAVCSGLWGVCLLCASPHPQILRVRKIKQAKAKVILIAQTWSKEQQFSDLPQLSVSAHNSRSIDPAEVSELPSGPRLSPLGSMGHRTLRDFELSCSDKVQEILLNSRKYSTCLCYDHKWKRFSLWIINNNIKPSFSSCSVHTRVQK